MTQTAFLELLRGRWRDPARLLCVGLDPEPERLPLALRRLPLAEGVWVFCREVIEACAPYVCAFKPQIAHFAALGLESVLERLVAHVKLHHPDIAVILDAKRGDIGSTARHYAREAFERYGADAVTVNPYLGGDSLEPFFAYPGKGVFVLCRTSNPGSAELQALELAGGERLFERVARLASGPWNTNGQAGLVVGATWPQEVARVRSFAPGVPLLVPGIGAQGGDLAATVRAGWWRPEFPGLILNSSRAILYASGGEDWQQASAAAAQSLVAEVRALLADLG
ncbi:MAG: orotidine-5'-phosphate decarboxylase [Tepidiphilus sp.]|nr:orotidine-5'-phosphate decarboxylase [Tepidiphilus sp.]MDD3433496.1 orotidine-5'-phosphate decarboxylase [Tepidiphilus sp.]